MTETTKSNKRFKTVDADVYVTSFDKDGFTVNSKLPSWNQRYASSNRTGAM